VQLAALLDNRSMDASELKDPVQVVVFSDRDHVLGLVVDQVVDIVDDAITVRQTTERAGLAGVAVVGKKVTDFLDLVSVFNAADEDWFEDDDEAAQEEVTSGVLVVDTSAFSRALTKNSLELAGHRVVEAASVKDALARLGKERFEAVVAAADLPADDAAALLRQARADAAKRVRVVGLTKKASDVKRKPKDNGYDCYVLRSDREALLRAVTGNGGALPLGGEVAAELEAQRS
jgi:two-component system, chemotaxis family, sensor kinase CheA